MRYIGRGPSKSGAFRILKDFSSSFNGSTTSFAIQDTNGTALSVATPQNLMIAVDGVMQEPGSAYTISGTNIVFGSAPQADATFWGVELGDIGGTSVSSSDQILVTATGHSFVVGRWMKATSTDGVYAYADCTTEPNAEVAGVIISTTTDTYTLQVHGTVTGDAVPAQASGTIMFLDASNGQMTTTETSTAGRVSKPLAIVTKNDSEMVILTYRGEVISSNVQTNAPNDAQYVALAANGTLTNERVLTAGSGISLTDAGAGGAITIASSGATINNATANELVTVASTTTQLDAEANLTFDGTNLTVGTGNVIIGTAGKGIDFSAQTPTSASGATTTSEVFDHYEEGTWTPAIADDNLSASESQAYSSQIGSYTRIGNKVFIQCYLRPSSLGNLTTGQTARIIGLPFPVGADATYGRPAAAVSGSSFGLTAGYNITARFSGGASDIRLLVWDTASGQSELSLSEFSADGEIYFSGFYTV